MQSRILPRLLPSVLIVSGCGEAPPRTPAVQEGEARPADSLVLTTGAGVEIWFTDARTAADSSGGSCTERVLEIRRGGERRPVPLLYTGAAPTLVNDSTIEARIWLHCRPGNTYQVNLRTGQPTRVK